MNDAFPVYTTPNECQDCYKCVRHCSCKAIRIVNARAEVIPELCVSCGECVKVCPAHAKKIRSDVRRAQFLLKSGAQVYASIAPSFVGYFPGVGLQSIGWALRRLGFAGCSETALGAELVSAATAEFLRDAPSGVYISGACPAAVDFLTRYHPDFAGNIVPVVSPVIAHSRLLHRHFGDEAKVVFFGPCAAKKNEADRLPGDLALAMTFPALAEMLTAANIALEPEKKCDMVPYEAEEGRCYSLEGGMNDTLRGGGDATIRYITVSGLDDLARLLRGCREKNFAGKLFIEALACKGGCINGPAMPPGAANADTVMRTVAGSGGGSSVGREVPVEVGVKYFPAAAAEAEVSPEELRRALASVGKFTAADELNCGGCGYNTCREFARAKIRGKAENAMCLSYLRKISQKTSNALIRCIPVGVVIVDQQLQIIECNRHFAEICGDDALQAFNGNGNLTGVHVGAVSDFSDLFDAALSGGGEIERLNQLYGRRIFNINVFSITPGQAAGAVIQDVTSSELKREQVAEKARQVIRENILTVQKIARDLGEHMAKTEILLDEVAGVYSEHKDGTENEQ